jgi:hypothetical protein
MPVIVPPGSVAVSPVRYTAVESSRFTSIAPVQQSLVPDAPPPVTCETLQRLVGVEPAFGTGNGAPKRQPAAEQFRLLPVAVDVVGPSVAAHPPPRLVICVISWPMSGRVCGCATAAPPPPR